MNKSLRVVDWRTSRYIRDAKRLMTNDTHVHNTHTHAALFFPLVSKGLAVVEQVQKVRAHTCVSPAETMEKQAVAARFCVCGSGRTLSHRDNKKNK